MTRRWQLQRLAAVLSYHQKKQADLAKEMLAQPDTRFAAAFDEWTSVAGKRWLTILLFSHKDCYNLGMIPVKDSANAKNIKMLISKKLASFGLTLEEHIISVICD